MQPIDEFVSKVPRIVFEKGVITFPENERHTFLFNNDRFFFVFNFFFGTLFGLFDLGMVVGIIITLVYLYFYIGQLPEKQEKTAE